MLSFNQFLWKWNAFANPFSSPWMATTTARQPSAMSSPDMPCRWGIGSFHGECSNHFPMASSVNDQVIQQSKASKVAEQACALSTMYNTSLESNGLPRTKTDPKDMTKKFLLRWASPSSMWTVMGTHRLRSVAWGYQACNEQTWEVHFGEEYVLLGCRVWQYGMVLKEIRVLHMAPKIFPHPQICCSNSHTAHACS